MNKDIHPKDSKGKWHGYQQWHYDSGSVWVRATFNHGKAIGYYEDHSGKQTIYKMR